MLRRLIKTGDSDSLAELLRHHKQKGISYFFEIEYRDNIDDLLEYYSLLEIGIIAGYFPQYLTDPMAKEIELILGNKKIQGYYTEYYPLYLPQLLRKNIKYYDPSIEGSSSIKDQFQFERFLLMNDSIKNDKDVDQFLWFLDDGRTGNFSISHLWEILGDANRIEYKMGSTISHPLNHALWGFIKYLQYLHDYASLLRESYNSLLLQSSFWHFQSYWFGHMENKLGEIMEKGIKNIRSVMEMADYYSIVNNPDSYVSNEKEFAEWRDNIESLYSIEADINFLSNSKMKDPILRELYGKL